MSKTSDFAEKLEHIYGAVFALTPKPRGRWGTFGDPKGRRYTKSMVSRMTTVECVYCGRKGPAHSLWQKNHKHHVRCTCLKIVALTALGRHLSDRRRQGNPCNQPESK